MTLSVPRKHGATPGVKTDSEILHDTKIELLRLRAQMTEVILNTSRQVAELSKQVKPRKERSFLRTECGLPSSELSTYVGFAKVLGGDFDTLEQARISFRLPRRWSLQM